MSGTSMLTVGDRGRLVIPAEMREKYGMRSGTPVALIECEQGLVLITREELLRRVRDDYSGLDLVDSLIADRHRTAASEAHRHS